MHLSLHVTEDCQPIIFQKTRILYKEDYYSVADEKRIVRKPLILTEEYALFSDCA